jgi:SH3 domain
VKALYVYSATIEEEFDFQAGDIIAVTATLDDGWCSGELFDENRRQKGRNVFASNFVCLFLVPSICHDEPFLYCHLCKCL